MTDMEVARVVHMGRRQGFAQGCGVAFLAFLVSAPFLFLADSVLAAAGALAASVLGILGAAAFPTNRGPDDA